MSMRPIGSATTFRGSGLPTMHTDGSRYVVWLGASEEYASGVSGPFEDEASAVAFAEGCPEEWGSYQLAPLVSLPAAAQETGR
jgi:hypothetical protein